MPTFVDHTGRKFGRLTVISRGANKLEKIQWLCRCECGATILALAETLVAGKKRSCGCLRREMSAARQRAAAVHGETSGGRPTPEYLTWCAMKKRCQSEAHRSFANYGGRGIAVCERWRESFPNFLADMGRRPSPQHSIERLDVDGSYSPDNCRWATDSEQAENKRNSRLVSHHGRTQTIGRWARELGISRSVLAARLRKGWPAEKAFTGRQRWPA